MAQTTGRPRTPSGASQPLPHTEIPPIPDSYYKPSRDIAPRRSSLGLFTKGSKKQQAALKEQELLRQQRALANKQPPKLPVLYNGAAPPQLQTFGGDDRPESLPIMSGRVAAAHPTRPSFEPSRSSSMSNAMDGNVDPYARTESMTHRGRYSYASSAVSTINSPRRVRRRKDPTPFK